MNKTAAVWLLIAVLLASRSFVRPAYAVALYMFTFLVAPTAWWWGDLLENFRWNFYAGNLLLLTVFATRSDDLMRGERPFSTNVVPIIAVMVINILAVHFLLAVNPDSSWGWVVLRLKFVLLFFMLQYAIRDEKDFRIVALTLALGMGYIGYEATINERGSFSGGRLEGLGAAGVTSSNHLASLLVTGIPLAVSVLFTDVKRWVKGAVLLACGFAFNVVLLCNSRGAFLGLILGGLAFLLMASGPARKQSRRIVGLAVVATVLLLGDPEIIQRFMSTFNSEGQRDASAESRIVFWTAASYMVSDYPLGSGGNSFSEGRGWQYLANETRVGVTRAIHNGFLTETTDWGVQGFLIAVAFLIAIWLTLLRGRRLARAAGDTNAMMVFACMATALTAWIVSSIFGDYLNDEWGFWTAALVYSYLRVRLLAPAEDRTRAAVPAPTASPHTWSPVIDPRATR